MIGWIKGRVLEKLPPLVLLDVHGVGYELNAPMTTFGKVPDVGSEVTLHVHMIVREDVQALYGFATRADRDLFRELLKVSGVGAKVALTILSGMDSAMLSQVLQAGDHKSLSRLPGIGKKTAERLIVELRDKLGAASGTAGRGGAQPVVLPNQLGSAALEPVDEASHALVALGMKPTEASRLAMAAAESGMSTEDIVRRALQGASA